MSRKFSVITTFHPEGYQKYGKRMIDTFLQNWPQEITLHVYAQDCRVEQSAPNLVVHDLHERCPDLVRFKEKYKDDPRANGQLPQGEPDRKGRIKGIGFRWQAVRFSHKVYAVCDHARQLETDTMIWMDADMVCHTPIPMEYIEQQCPVSAGIAFLGRRNKFTECGLYALNMRDPATKSFVKYFQNAYDDAENGVFTMEEYNDCWVFDRVRERIQAKNPSWTQLNWSQGFEGEGHVLINTSWGQYLDHLKGKRKDHGKSFRKDLRNLRSEHYWQSAV